VLNSGLDLSLLLVKAATGSVKELTLKEIHELPMLEVVLKLY